MLRENLKVAIKESGMLVKEIAGKSRVNKRTIDKWVGVERIEPKVYDLYAVCKVLGITIEWAIDDEKGQNYIRQLITDEGRLWEPPKRIRAIVKVLESLNDNILEIVKKMITSLQCETLVHPLFANDQTFEYDPIVFNICRFIPKSKRQGIVRFAEWEMLMLPFYGKINTGQPINIYYYPDQAIPFPRKRLKGNPKNYFVVQVMGNSLQELDIKDGDYVVIYRSKIPVNGKIMLIQHENDIILGRIETALNNKGHEHVFISQKDGSKIDRLPIFSYEILGEFFLNLRE